MSNPSPLDIDQLIDEAFGGAMPASFASRGNPSSKYAPLVTESGPLTAEHISAAEEFMSSGRTLGVNSGELKAIRHTHHRLAQLLAGGMDETRAAVLCNFHPNRVSFLKNRDPAFRDLLAYYTANVETEFMDFVTAAKDLSLDFLGKLQQDLDETPEKFTPQLTLEAIRVLADRTGHAPVQKSVVVNVNANAADRLARARARVREATALIEGSATVVSQS